MCDYTEVEYKCGHVRYLVRAWCVIYQQTQQRCPPNVVAQYDFPSDPSLLIFSSEAQMLSNPVDREAFDIRERRLDDYCGKNIPYCSSTVRLANCSK